MVDAGNEELVWEQWWRRAEGIAQEAIELLLMAPISDAHAPADWLERRDMLRRSWGEYGTGNASNGASRPAGIIGEWLLCPRCTGQGHTNRPPWVPGDQATWESTTTVSHSCPPCKGTGLLVVPKQGGEGG